MIAQHFIIRLGSSVSRVKWRQ